MTDPRPEDPLRADAPADGVLHPERNDEEIGDDELPRDPGPTEFGSTAEG
jgi:hypothetical protein